RRQPQGAARLHPREGGGCVMDHIIPAAAGYYILCYCGKGAVTREPVVGWRIEPCEMHATPVVLDPQRGCKYINPPVLCPDGQVIKPFDHTWDSEQSWLSDMQETETRAAIASTDDEN